MSQHSFCSTNNLPFLCDNTVYLFYTLTLLLVKNITIIKHLLAAFPFLPDTQVALFVWFVLNVYLVHNIAITLIHFCIALYTWYHVCIWWIYHNAWCYRCLTQSFISGLPSACQVSAVSSHSYSRVMWPIHAMLSPQLNALLVHPQSL